jgi:Bacteriophage probable baseplate hub protein
MTMTIEQIERARSNFYAPAFNVKVSNQSLVQDLHLEVASVSVDNTLDMAARFSFTINNAFDIAQRDFLRINGKTLPEIFAFGSPVEIYMGYGDRSKLDLMVTGVLTELSTSFPSSGLPQLTLSGYDNSYCLTKGTASKPWENKKDSDVVREIAGDYKLNAKVDDTKVVHPRIERSQESAAQFVTRLANRNGFEFFVTQKDLMFRKPANDQRGVIELKWGRGLVSFSPEINLSE